jgi:dihydroneopterin aldolase/2-amino-4-hydroxy-6-hydroxymethyldihydropteridine diphosphokinase/dihydropteroate synthase
LSVVDFNARKDDSSSCAGQSGFFLPNLNTETSVWKNKNHTVYIAFGSNQGDQLWNIKSALEHLSFKGVKIVNTSTLYESKPMYHLDQPNFVNGVVKASTTLSPQDLLATLKNIEYKELQRVKQFANGPRTIDLDILLYDNVILNEPDLNIPHIRLIERSFVLAPLCELIDPSEIHPVTTESYHDHLKQLFESAKNMNGDNMIDSTMQESIDLTNVIPLPRATQKYLKFDMLGNTHRTLVMGILNTTPDSFSDGGKNTSVEKALETALNMVKEGVDIIDVGGCSTRPGSLQPSEEEELSRVVPIVEAIRNSPDAVQKGVVISVDTYRAKVAVESLKLGADIINDISGGTFDDKMYDVIAETGAPYIINHTWGTIQTMTQMTDYDSAESSEQIEFLDPANFEHLKLSKSDLNVAKSVARELSHIVAICTAKGIKRWQLIIDPGLGFAKNGKQNLSIIRSIPVIKNYSCQYNQEHVSLQRLPILIGASRKRFIGDITREPQADKRVIGSCAVLMACIGSGSDIIRVHDCKESKQTCLMGDAIYKGLI